MAIFRFLFLLFYLKYSNGLSEVELLQNMNTMEIIQAFSYPAEEHKVTTEDGYILTLHRIPGKRGSKPLLFMHGLFSASSFYLLPRSYDGLPFMAHDAGFDIWLGNNRGNIYAQKHTTLDTNSSKFWDFSWHEMGVYDLPCIIDYILNETNYKQLDYLGLSEGGTIYFVMTSERPSYNKKIHTAYLLAPIVYFQYTTSWSTILFRNIILGFQNVKGLEAFNVGNSFLRKQILTNPLFINLFDLITYFNEGFAPNEYNEYLMRYLRGHISLGTSVKQLYHYLQLVGTKYFRYYDYGPKKNLEYYKSEDPPEYKLNQSTAPIVLIYGEKDRYVNIKDLNHLISRLSNVVAVHCIEGFNHNNLVLGNNVRTKVNELILYQYLLKL